MDGRMPRQWNTQLALFSTPDMSGRELAEAFRIRDPGIKGTLPERLYRRYGGSPRYIARRSDVFSKAFTVDALAKDARSFGTEIGEIRATDFQCAVLKVEARGQSQRRVAGPSSVPE